ncbi:MAG TPA: hypothetical protein PLV70_00420 [Flavobacteriales bacterium]|nr:hypothetical protein [Flavobacteriales bacterium]HRN36366.1 hypothetical protein [Flavobacteriales bacterium]HRO38503.1 hypothetical protein [Flavobacteriales bacterium]HRP80887.1 hypothetical protein [Flavobacteriales bacterium]HRQ83556.1 hypothetical protein [Flavobacteriales bacterium]
MHAIEPYFNWRHLYTAETDPLSPFHGAEHSEFEFTHAVYDHVIHPQWDSFGSSTLYLKVLFADYETGHVVIELIGEWNDLLHNDIMYLKRDVVEPMLAEGLHKFILIGENVLNFHAGEEDYYAEWFEETMDAGGWIALVNFHKHVREDLQAANLDQYLLMGGKLDALPWRTWGPDDFCARVERIVVKRLA